MSTVDSPSLFTDMRSYEDVALMLGVSPKQLRFLLHARPESQRYTTFSITKRRGGLRSIKAPRGDLKAIQRRFADFLQDNIPNKPAAHGFVRERSIVTNAQLHVRHRTVLNIDLKDFFPTINFGRVRGLFMAHPLGASPEVATILAQLCCHVGSLPQGAPTSPVVSNMICYRMDAQLLRLAREYKCIYTRYADDLTFSKQRGMFPVELAVEDATGNMVVGKILREIIEKNQFIIHPDKVHLHHNTHRQTVTGLTVNSRVNVPRKFVREIRAIISDWRVRGLAAAQATHHEQFYRRPSRLGEKPPLQLIVEGKLNFLKMVKGPTDPVRRNLQRQLVAVWPEYQNVLNEENEELKMRDFFISHASEDKKDFVRPLVDALIRAGVSVWYDEFDLTIGDDLLVKINDGLTKSYYGIVILSPNFFNIKKTWPDREVGAMFALEDADGRPRVLPIWHNVGQPEVAAKNPILAAKVAWKSAAFTVDQLAIKAADFMKTRRK